MNGESGTDLAGVSEVAIDPHEETVAASEPAAAVQVERELTGLLRRVEAALARKPATERLVRSAYGLLSTLEARGPLGIAALAEATHVDVSTASRQVVPLERQRFVRRLSDPADGRASLIEITPSGRERLQVTRHDRLAAVQAILRDWPEQDQRAFAAYLARFSAAMARREGD